MERHGKAVAGTALPHAGDGARADATELGHLPVPTDPTAYRFVGFEQDARMARGQRGRIPAPQNRQGFGSLLGGQLNVILLAHGPRSGSHHGPDRHPRTVPGIRQYRHVAVLRMTPQDTFCVWFAQPVGVDGYVDTVVAGVTGGAEGATGGV